MLQFQAQWLSLTGITGGFHLLYLFLIKFSALVVDWAVLSIIFSWHTQHQISNRNLPEGIVPYIWFSNQDNSSHDCLWLSYQMRHCTDVSRRSSGSGLLGWWDGELINRLSCKDESFWTPVYLPLVVKTARISMHWHSRVL